MEKDNHMTKRNSRSSKCKNQGNGKEKHQKSNHQIQNEKYNKGNILPNHKNTKYMNKKSKDL
jgi:hypothetical protein